MKTQRRMLSVLLAVCIMFSVMIGFTTVTAQDMDNLPVDTLKESSKEYSYDESATAVESSSILRYVDEAEFKSKGFKRRVPEQETLSTYVFQSDDGTKTVYFLGENVKFINNEGTIVEKDVSLVRSGQGYGIAQSDIELTIPDDPDRGISLVYSGYTVTITPTENKIAAIAEKKGNSIIYNGVFGSNTTLRYTPLLSGVKEDIILSAYTSNAGYSFSIKTGGLNLYNNDKGCYLGKNEDTVLFNFGTVILYDALGKTSEGSVSVEAVKAGEEYTVTVIVDDVFLSDPTTVYPVTIDPSIRVSDNTHGAGAIEDAPIFENKPLINFGTFLYNRMGKPDNDYGVGRTVVRLTELIGSEAYQSITAAQITNVSFYAKESSGGSTQFINLYPLTSNTTWTESTVKWSDIGSGFTTSVNYGATMTNNAWTGFDITNLVKAWKNGTFSASAGFIMTNENEIGNNKSFDSCECPTLDNRPYVEMTYEPNYDYEYIENAPIQYTYRTTLNLTAGQTITISTGKATSYNDVDTVVHLFNKSNPTDASWGNDDYGGTLYSQLGVTIETSGEYILLVRCYGNQTGYCNVYKNGALYKENAPLGGYKLSCHSNDTGKQNFFTANSLGVDTILYVMDIANRVVAYNDDYHYQNESETGNFLWGNHSRVHINSTDAPKYVFVCGYSTAATGTTDIYSNCRDGFSDYAFPNLKAIDSIKADNVSSLYNCIAWSGGMAHTWVDPDLSQPYEMLSPWYNSNNVIAFDNFYGNSPLRYAGATSYIYTSNAEESVVDVYFDGYEWTHASVRKPGNNQPHGYAWESKCGSAPRIFHPRYSLQGFLYGDVSRYYKVSNPEALSVADRINGITFEDSIASGRTVLLDVRLTDSEFITIRNSINNLDGSVAGNFTRLYAEWKDAVLNHEELKYSSNSNDYVTIPEYETLAQLIKCNNNAWVLVIEQYLQDRDVFSMTLFNHLVVACNEKTLSLADAIRKTNNSISENSMKSEVYIAPTYETNAICLIKELLNNNNYIG